MAYKVTRYITPTVERELWARAAGRCEFNGCNKILYKSPITQESVNIAEKAHIYSFSEKGPRGWGPLAFHKKELNNINNLMLVCHACHKTIDKDKAGVKYSAELLQEWKKQHELRINIVTGICPDYKTHIVFYGANIGDESSLFSEKSAIESIFPEWWPVSEHGVKLSMACSHEDSTPDYWKTEKNHLSKVFDRHIKTRIEEAQPYHFSLFAMAPQPLLILIGTFFTDKIPVEVYQPHREPQTWKWLDVGSKNDFNIIEPETTKYDPVLIISLSDKIKNERITSVIGDDVSIWELTVGDYHNDFMKSKAQLSNFRAIIRKLMVMIREAHGIDRPLKIFPAMPIACAVEFGRVRMPKAEMLWILYDQNSNANKFIETIKIGTL